MEDEVAVPPVRRPMYMRRVREMFEDARVAAVMGNPYSLYIDIEVTYDYMDFILSWLMPPIIYDVMPLPRSGLNRQVGSSQIASGVAMSVVAAISEAFIQFHSLGYNIRRDDGGFVHLKLRPHEMDPEDLVLMEEVLRPKCVSVSTTWRRDIRDWISFTKAHIRDAVSIPSCLVLSASSEEGPGSGGTSSRRKGKRVHRRDGRS